MQPGEDNNAFINALKKSGDTGISFLNGIYGDSLAKKNDKLAIQMGFYKDGKPLELSKDNLKKKFPEITPKICILVHGLVLNESCWDLKDGIGSYGTLLQKEFGYTPFSIRYNTGLHISENGKDFSKLISELTKEYPVPVEEIIILSHSMGGLVTRSACYYGDTTNEKWIPLVRKIFFIGTPHLGAPLEKFGNIVTNILKSIPIAYTILAGGIINLRSAGIKDLRFGYIRDEDWQGEDPDALLKNTKAPVHSLPDVEYYAISGTLSKKPGSFLADWFGDALVRKKSSVGDSKKEEHKLFIPESNFREYQGISHLGLIKSLDVFEQIKSWVKG